MAIAPSAASVSQSGVCSWCGFVLWTIASLNTGCFVRKPKLSTLPGVCTGIMPCINVYGIPLHTADDGKKIKKLVQEEKSYPANNPKRVTVNGSQLRLWGKGKKMVHFTLGLTVSSC